MAGLTLEDKRELLELLELREQSKPEPVVDNRPSLESFVDEIRDQAAAQSSDLDAYTTAWQAHVAAVLRISERLAGDRPRVTEPPSSAALSGLFNAQYMTRMARIALMPPKAMRCRPSETL